MAMKMWSHLAVFVVFIASCHSMVGDWGAWSSWSECFNELCGQESISRSRDCPVDDCGPGSTSEDRFCTRISCTELAVQDAQDCLPGWFFESAHFSPRDLPQDEGAIIRSIAARMASNRSSSEFSRPAYMQEGYSPWASNSNRNKRASTTHVRRKRAPVTEGDCRAYSTEMNCIAEARRTYFAANAEGADIAIELIMEQYTEACSLLNCVFPMMECIGETPSSEDSFCENLDDINRCMRPLLRPCEAYQHVQIDLIGGEELATHMRKELAQINFNCTIKGCENYMSTCSVLQEISLYHRYDIMTSGFTLCRYLPRLVECYSNMPQVCASNLQYGLYLWDVPLEVDSLWTPEVKNFIRNTMHAYFEEEECSACVNKMNGCMVTVMNELSEGESEEELVGIAQCRFTRKVGECIADVIRNDCDSLWGPSRLVIAKMTEDLTAAVELVCLMGEQDENCQVEQSRCVNVEPFLDFLFSMPVLMLEYLGLDLRASLYNGLTRNRILAGLGRNNDDPRSNLGRSGFYGSEEGDFSPRGQHIQNTGMCSYDVTEELECVEGVYGEICNAYDISLRSHLTALDHVFQFGCWLFTGDYSNHPITDLAWFEGLTRDDMDLIWRMMERDLSPLPTPLPREPDYITQGIFVAMEARLNVDFNPIYLNEQHPITMRFKSSFAQNMKSLLRETLSQLDNVIVIGFFEGSLGVKFVLVFHQPLDIAEQSRVAVTVAQSLNEAEHLIHVNDMDYEVTTLRLAMRDANNEFTSVEIDIDNPNICSLVDVSGVCGRGFCDVHYREHVACRCPNGELAISCDHIHGHAHEAGYDLHHHHDYAHDHPNTPYGPGYDTHYHHDHSHEHSYEHSPEAHESDGDSADDLLLWLGLIGVGLIAFVGVGVVATILVSHRRRAVERKRLARKRRRSISFTRSPPPMYQTYNPYMSYTTPYQQYGAYTTPVYSASPVQQVIQPIPRTYSAGNLAVVGNESWATSPIPVTNGSVRVRDYQVAPLKDDSFNVWPPVETMRRQSSVPNLNDMAMLRYLDQ